MIKLVRLDYRLLHGQELNAIQGGANDAEWNFLVGSAYYYKGAI